jgi:hypothetical protein
MLTYLPGTFGPTLHAVKPGANNKVAAAKRRYDEARSRNLTLAVVLGGFAGVAAPVVALSFGFLQGGPDGLDKALAVAFFFVIALAVVGGISGMIVWSVLSARAEDNFNGETRDLIRNANLLEHYYRSGYATDEEEWEAAALAHEASELGTEAYLAGVNDELHPVRLTSERVAHINALQRKARKMESRVVRLLDPKLTRRRRRKTAVVG